ncbi:sensor histidine kinase [Paenibacillus mucilaginosus]|uniref:histidine kinase n=2 Tax=Paenibacillus mucilaginosus TaxID=61624 RepID=H6NGC3_9BACL|nr:HAMP domain-containing sensor histidine kinase [Paenibacillus mucilaginosus]AEI45271.1 signal transduction histidine kinase [Paenibacillus mucilaginosus KNP414]AFC33005.1 signal transduction histidine kinase [Paenibacillus mucilaginosus 3016]MCG7212842.1 HAMP domain-containing histidine kinase [Paenibacillus mucilaginosus]WDM26736.1 HAMP domain-containing histidine kinase [Paenibacillus mucilaginosus]WFA21447.1 HAMP domain-containing histidine kinase [Paenibacillus mucilaginosus]
MSIRLRLTLWYTAILSATLLLLGVGLYFFLYYYYFNSLKPDLQRTADVLRTRIQYDGYSFQLNVRDQLRYNNLYFQVVSLEDGGKTLSPSLAETGLELPDLKVTKIRCIVNNECRFDKIQMNNVHFLMYSTPVTVSGLALPGEPVIGIMQAIYEIDDIERLLAMLRLILTVTGLLSILLAASVGWFLARKALRPIEQVIMAANRIERGVDLDKRIEYFGPSDEIGELTQTINGMLERLQTAYSEMEEAYGAQRRFVSDASHELRTPLTTIRGNVDLLEKMWKNVQQGALAPGEVQLEMTLEAMHDISGEAERMSRLVNDLLSLARADAGFQMAKTEIQLLPLLEEVARKAQLLPRTVEFRTGPFEGIGEACIQGNADYIRQLLFIFIENAFKYTDGGFALLDASLDGDQVGIRIEDSGIGMDKEEVPHIFERFYRADPSRGKKAGTGLGLSIAKWIIDEHGGSVEVRTRKNEGTAFTIWLPVLPCKDVAASGGTQGHSLPEGNQV